MATPHAQGRLIEVAAVRRMLKAGEAQAIREFAGITRPELASALGVHPSDIYRWETGRRVPRPDLAERYGQCLARLGDVATRIGGSE